jgi:peptidoglycan/LPS O-acetylase OafA/YrhL
MSLEKYRKNNSLDALRAIAAYGVVVAHTYGIPPLKIPSYLTSISLMSYFVQVFFVLSALSLLLNNKFEDNKSIRSYYIKRFFRIVPLFYFFVILYSSIYAYPGFSKILLNLTLSFEIFSPESCIVWAGWTLGVEAVFYLFLPIIYILIQKPSHRIVFFVLVVFASFFFHGYLYSKAPASTYFQASFLANMGCFAFGGIIAETLRTEGKGAQFSTRKKIAFYGVAALLCALIATDYFVTLGAYIYNRRTLYGFVAFLVIYAEIKRPSSFLRGYVWSNLAKLSYGIYLWHPFVIYNLKGLYGQVYAQIPVSNTLAFLVCTILTIIITTLAATLTYFMIERPAIQLGRKLVSGTTDQNVPALG